MSFRNPNIGSHLTYNRTVEKRLGRARRKVVPPMPQNAEDVYDCLRAYAPVESILRGHAQSTDGGQAVIFSTEKLLQELATTSFIFIDGTFSVLICVK